MTNFFHITDAGRWQEALRSGSYRDPSLETEGFIHGSYHHQVVDSANKHYGHKHVANDPAQDAGDLLLLEIDPSLLDVPVVVEDSYNSGQSFPHLYGPLPSSAVVATHVLVHEPDGRFSLPATCLASGKAQPQLPTSAELARPSKWRGEHLAASPGEWSRPLTSEELMAVNDLATGTDPSSASQRTVEALAEEIRNALIEGLGFRLIKGVPIQNWTQAEREQFMLRLGQAIGQPRSQNAAGHLVGHVRDVGADLGDPTTRIYQTSQRQTFHTDSTDAVGLLCLATAAEGGQSMLASASYIYERLVEQRPDLAPKLFEPVATDRRGEEPEGMKPWFEIPVLNWHQGLLTVLYQRQYIESARRFDDAPHPDPTHTEALDLFDEIANTDGVALVMDLEPGDLQFVYNHSLLHDRTGFVDHPEPEQRRYLLRLWLSLPGDRELPEVFTQRYGSITVGDRGGIVVT